MASFMGQFVPFFLLVGCGWAAVRVRLVSPDAIGALNAFVLFFGLPAMLFRLGASGALLQSGLPALLWVYGLGGVLITSLALGLGRRARWSHRDTGLVALATAFPNTGFLGLPLLTGLLGAQAAGPVAATLVIDVLLLSSLCLAWSHQGDGAGWRAWLGAPLRGALRNPLLWSMACGVGWWALDVAMPRAIDDTLRLLGQAASPAALFTLGAILARAQLRARADAQAGMAPHEGRLLATLVAGKLLLHPALVCALGLTMQAAGVALKPSDLTTLVMAAALPSASNVSMLAEREGADTARVARLIMWTTALSWLTLAAWAAWRGASPAGLT